MQQPPQNVYTFSIHKVLCCAQKRFLTTCVCCSKHFENREPSAHIILDKICSQNQRNRIRKDHFQQQCCKFYEYGYHDIPAFGFTFLESKRFCGCALQRVPQRNIRRSLHKDSVPAGNVLYRYRGAGGTVVLLRHYCRQLYREREQPFQPGARADSVIRHSGGMLRNRDPETKKAGQMPRFAYLSCVQVKRACETESPSRRK